MKKAWLCTLGLMLLAMGAFGASLAEAGSLSGVSKFYYATPSWDQKLQCDITACPRFIVLSDWGNAAVLDLETGLVWEQSPSTSTFTWDGAQLQCNRLTTGDRLGWRLPTIQELTSLADPTQSNPALPSGHPFSNVQSAGYWPATTAAVDPTLAWVVEFYNGNVFKFYKSFSLFVWCVRGGHGVDPQ
jgi:hypothetical protein